MFEINDTIVALATPPGGAPRGILRLSGERAWEMAGQSFHAASAQDHKAPGRAIAGHLSLPQLNSPVPATLYLGRAPHTYTGQDLVEVHTLGSPPILELGLSTLVSRGARQAIPGEFTVRAFLNGKLDLTTAEAIVALIDAANSRQADVALRQMAGGIARPINRLRDQFLDLLAELEAGLDFAEEDLAFIDRAELRANLRGAIALLRELEDQMNRRAVNVNVRRAVLMGPPNVGKSSLFNALLGRDAALVSATAGTTRDYLVGQLNLTGGTLELIDTAGIDASVESISQLAQQLREQIVQAADLVIWCVDSADPNLDNMPPNLPLRSSCVLIVHTKRDLLDRNRSHAMDHRTPDGSRVAACSRDAEFFAPVAVSARTGAGLTELRDAIERWVTDQKELDTGVVASTATRCRQSIAGALSATHRALDALDADAGDDLVAMEIRLALDQLGEVVGAVYADDILDRIFSRFCIGK